MHSAARAGGVTRVDGTLEVPASWLDGTATESVAVSPGSWFVRGRGLQTMRSAVCDSAGIAPDEERGRPGLLAGGGCL